MLIARNLSKTYIIKEKKNIFFTKSMKEVEAVKNISLKIKPGQIIGLLGINGAGKTTTIKMLAGLLEPTSGTYFIDNIDGAKEHKKIKEIINMITGGERNIYWRLTANENLEYFGGLYGLPSKLMNERINDILNMVGLSDVKDLPVERYSKGMKQRLQIARGLINDPKYIFLDEPTLGLDISIAKDIRAYIKKLAVKEGKGVLLTTHYISEAEELCDYIYVINKGELVTKGTSNELKAKIKKSFDMQINLDTINENDILKVENEVKKLNGCLKVDENDMCKIVVSTPDNCVNNILKALSEHNISVSSIKILELNLEDVLIKIITEDSNSAKVS